MNASLSRYSKFKQGFALVHNLCWTAGLLFVTFSAFEHAPPELWYGLKTQLLLSENSGPAEVWFVSILAFCLYSAAYVIFGALLLAWLCFLWRRYFVSIAVAWLSLSNVGVLAVLFGLPLAN